MNFVKEQIFVFLKGASILSEKTEESDVNSKKISKPPIVKVEVRDENNKVISSKVEIQPQPTVTLSSGVQVVEGEDGSSHKIISSIVEIKTDGKEPEAAVEVDANNIDKPEYDFLHRQPSEVVDETYKVRTASCWILHDFMFSQFYRIKNISLSA